MSTSPPIQPIDTQQRAIIEEKVGHLIRKAAADLEKKIGEIEIRFDLKGSAAGMYCSNNRQRWFRFNPYLFAKYFEENLQSTVPHEVAHYLVDTVFGRSVRPHGREWQTMMKLLGYKPDCTHQFDLSGIPVKRQRRHQYSCSCMQHEISTTRHNRIQKNKHQAYYCRRCGDSLEYRGN